ncbi:thiamine pyrophosphokinase [Xylariaceae sp. AK1471]|nr:thiamine pyrophosphokinase [Xylariaceae sp. AK1471]
MDSTPDSDSIEWNPIRLFLGYPGYEFVFIVLHQPIRDPLLFRDLWSSAVTKIAADGGANQIYDLSKQAPLENGNSASGFKGRYTDLDTIIGDLDSLSDEARQHFSRSHIIRDPDQYSTDFTKAVRHARRGFPGRDLVCMGGLGGRVDQGLSQLHHLYMFQTSPKYADGRMYLLSGESLSFVLKGGQRHRIRVREPNPAIKDGFRRISGDPFAKYVGIIPVGGSAVISTKGLEWDVQDWPTAFGGQMSTSNHVLPETEVVDVQTDKDVLFTIALKQVPVT